MSVGHSRIQRYRVYCVDESVYKSVWGGKAPTVCPDDCMHAIDATKTVVIDDIPITKNPLTSFDELRVSERTGIIELKSIYGKSELRDRYIGSVTNNLGDSEYNLRVTSSNDVSAVISAQRGRYVAGTQGEVGIAVRVPEGMSNDQQLRIGLFDESNGFFFMYNSNGINTVIRRDGVDAVTERGDFNWDAMDGTGPSKYCLDSKDGIVYTIRFSWYGYGNIEFRMNTTNSLLEQSTWLANVYSPYAETSVKTPNLPISVELRNNGTVATTDAFVAGRQYAILGRYHPISRMNSLYVSSVSINSSSSWIPMFSIRRKTGYLGNSIKGFGMDSTTTQDLYIQVRTSGTPNSPVWSTPPDMDAADTAVEVDTNSTSLSGGKPIWTGMVAGDKNAYVGDLNIMYDMSEYDAITVLAKGITSTNGTISAVFRWKEEW